jgi:hypothetical protein
MHWPGLWTLPSRAGGGRASEPGVAFWLRAEIPPPLGIGSVTTNRGETVKYFICEPYALAGALDITEHGGWRAWRASLG